MAQRGFRPELGARRVPAGGRVLRRGQRRGRRRLRRVRAEHAVREQRPRRALDGACRPREIPSAPTWSFPPRPWTSHVRWIAPSPDDADLLLVGIELGGVMRSQDGGVTWSDHRPGAQPDCHSLAWHPSGRAYEAGGGEPRGASTAGPRGSQPTRGATVTTSGRSRSTRRTPTSGSCRRAPGRTPRTAAGRRRRSSIAGGEQAPGSRSPAGFPSPSTRCRTRSPSPTACSRPASPTAIYASRNAGDSWERVPLAGEAPERILAFA